VYYELEDQDTYQDMAFFAKLSIDEKAIIQRELAIRIDVWTNSLLPYHPKRCRFESQIKA